jgi:hypothetical protein
MGTAFKEHPHIWIGHWRGGKVAFPPFFKLLRECLAQFWGLIPCWASDFSDFHAGHS